MSKQDRQGVRKPSDLEQKYDFGGMGKQQSQQNVKLSQTNQALAQFEATAIAKMAEFEGMVGTLEQSVQEFQQAMDEELAGFEEVVNDKIEDFENQFPTLLLQFYPVGSIYINLYNVSPSTLFGGTWEVVQQGYLVVGLDQEEDTNAAELKYLDKCYIWKRTA